MAYGFYEEDKAEAERRFAHLNHWDTAHAFRERVDTFIAGADYARQRILDYARSR